MKPVMNVTSATVKAAAHGVPRPGQLIADRYKLDRPLERGAMGSVWRAEQVRLRAPVAVKFLDPSLIGDKEMHDRFIQEARSAAAVRSAHVVQVFDYGTEDGVPYIAMELLDGENLDARLGARGTLSPAELAKLFIELARGIGQAHAIGVIHRDLKPGNIFIAREGEHEVTKIVDFGIAKVKASALRLTQGIGTQLGTLLGTPQYMSPEQVRGSSSIDHRTDLWALAVIACECLTGRCPFSGATLGDLTVQICTERPPAPSSLGPVPPGFDQWFFKATHKKPTKRFQTVEEMAERLQAVLGPAILATPGVARGRRLITFPSSSEVRLAYSAVVTWKGFVVNRLSQTWIELRRLMLRVGHYLAIQWEVAQQRLRELLESERLTFMRPMVERHGMLASVALLCSGILLLGLTTRGGDPVVASPPGAEPAPAEATTPGRAAASLGVVAAPQADVMRGEAQLPSLPEPGSLIESGAGAAVVPSEPNVSERFPASESQPTSLAAYPLERAGLADSLAPLPGGPELERAGTRAAGDEGVSDPTSSSAARHGRLRTEVANVEGADPHPRNGKPANGDSSGGTRKEGKPAAKAAPITKAMAQAAAKVMNADDLVASIAVKKPAARATAPRAAVPQPPQPAKPSAGPTKANPFDDRL
jgi:serine/threonine protein kinase